MSERSRAAGASGGGVPIGERLAVAPAEIDRGDQPIAGMGVETGQEPAGAAENGDRKLAAVGAHIGVAADDRDGERFRGGAKAGEDRRGLFAAIRPDRIDDGDRPAAHRGDIRDVDHHPAPAGKPWVGGDEFVDEAFDGEEQVAVAIRDRRAVVADRNRRRRREAELLGDRPDVGLRGKATRVAQRLRERAHVEPLSH